MSKTIGKVVGSTEFDTHDVFMMAISFYGGKDRGRCLELALTNNKHVIELTMEEVQKLHDLLSLWLES